MAPDTTLSGSASSMGQTNGTVSSVTVSGGVIYAGGSFTQVRPSGSAAGQNQTARTDLAAFNSSTGAVTSFNPTLNGAVNSVAVSSDGSTLYIAGAFTTVNGSTRNRFAAFTIATGALTSWNPNASGGSGYAVLPSSAGVYLGGTFTKVGGVAHQALASVSTSTGALQTAFTATADAEVATMTLTTDGSNRLIVGGNFNTIAGVAHHALASLNPTTGADQAWAGDGVLPNIAGDGTNPFSGCTSNAAVVLYYQGTVYVGGDGLQPGCFDGDFAVSTGGSTGSGQLLWNNPCEGATAAMTIINGVLYKGSHMHDCAYNAGGPNGGMTGSFDRNNRAAWHLIAQNLSDGSFLHWYPNTNGGAPTYLGPFAMATDGSQLVVGGEFSQVNGVNQQGLTRFGPLSTSGSAAPIKPTVAPSPVVTGLKTVTISVPFTWDPDNGVLTYQLYRGTTLVGTAQTESWPWGGPTVRFNVTVPSGSSGYSFKYNVTDGKTTSGFSPTSATVIASASNSPAAYPTTVSSASPSTWWRLNGNGDDASGGANTATSVGGVTYSSTGAVSGDGSASVNGSTGYLTSSTSATLPSSFSESVWFKGTSLHGGDLLGVSQNQTGADTNADRAVWMDDDGQLAFAMKTVTDPNAPPGPPNATVRSLNTYNDGAWHQAVATYDGTTMSLYVDGSLASSTTATAAASTGASYYYRAGYTDLSGLAAVFGTNTTSNTAPNSYFFNGSLDEVSYYGQALTAAQVAAQYGSVAPSLF